MLGWRFSLLLCGLGPVLAISSLRASGPIRLFNGRNLDGWYVVIDHQGVVAQQSVFEATEGMIHTYPNAGDGSPQPRAALITQATFSDYRLALEYRWGKKKFGAWAAPDRVRDAGVCFDIFGPNEIWPSGVECQIEEGDTGDVWLTHVRATSMLNPHFDSFLASGTDAVPITRGAKDTGFRFPRSNYYEIAGWNHVEVTVHGDRATYRVNGHVNNEVFDLRYWNPATAAWEPLTRGKILLQAECSEVYYRNVTLTPLGK